MRPRATQFWFRNFVELQRRDLPTPSEELPDRRAVRLRGPFVNVPSRAMFTPEAIVMISLFEGCGDDSLPQLTAAALSALQAAAYGPGDVFLGRALFGHRRPFVTASGAAAALSQTLISSRPISRRASGCLARSHADFSSPTEGSTDSHRHVPIHQHPAPSWRATASQPPNSAPVETGDDMGYQAARLRARRSGARLRRSSARLKSAIWPTASSVLGPLDRFRCKAHA